MPARRVLWKGSPQRAESDAHGIGYCVPDNAKSLMTALQKYAPPPGGAYFCSYPITLMNKEDETTFDAVIKSRGRPSMAPPQTKRHKISMHGALVTDAEVRR